MFLKKISFAQSFFASLVIALLIASGISVFVVTPYIERSVLQMQKESSQKEKELISAYLEHFLSVRIAITQDIASYPIVKNGAMGSGISEQDVADFLNETTILGEDEGLVLLNILAEPIYARGIDLSAGYRVDAPWFKRVLDGVSEFEVNLVEYDTDHYFQLVVPVKLNEYVEGVMLSNIKVDLDRILTGLVSSKERALILKKHNTTIQTAELIEKEHASVLTKILSIGNINMEYRLDTSAFQNQKDAFLLTVILSIVVTLGITFLIVIASGNYTIVMPYQRMVALTRERDIALMKAQDSAQAKSAFLASMSHEIRTPLNGIMGMLALLGRGNLKDQQVHYVNLAKTSADSLLSLINDILDFSKIEAGKLDLEVIEFDLSSHIEKFMHTMAFRAEEKNVELLLDSSLSYQSYVKGDPSRLRQILTNLVGNAIKFSENGEVVVKAELLDCKDETFEFRCSVSDNGIGIPEDKIAGLFDSFNQVDSSTTRKFGGTGLGLAIVKQLCEIMGGTVTVKSDYGLGSKFEFSVPLIAGNTRKNLRKTLHIEEQRILVLESNDSSRKVIRNTLESLGAVVEEANSVNLAVSAIQKSYRQDDKVSPISVVIANTELPEVGSTWFTKTLRQDKTLSSLKIIAMTTVSQRSDAMNYARLGYDSYFSKPATASDLLCALEVLEDKPTLNTPRKQRAMAAPKESILSIRAKDSRILLVEDNTVNQEVALGLLADLGAQADTANNGIEALAALRLASRTAPYSLILMDCQMPGMDGYQATEAIRNGRVEYADKNIPIIAMTANAMKGDREKCIDAGMSDYIAKPIDPNELIGKLNHWLGGDQEFEIEQAEGSADDTYDEEIWDKNALISRVRGKEERLAKLVKLYCDGATERYESLLKAIAEQNFDDIHSCAHALKGSSANLGGVRITAVLQELETNRDIYALDRLKVAFEEAFQAFFDVLTHYLESSSSK